jgi:hypothetical protein
MQGNCTGTPPTISSPSLLQLKPGQCVLLVDRDPIAVPFPGQRLLLSNLYLRLAMVSKTSADHLMSIYFLDVHVWLEDVTFQGSFRQGKGGHWTGVAVNGEGARLYASGARCDLFVHELYVGV